MTLSVNFIQKSIENNRAVQEIITIYQSLLGKLENLHSHKTIPPEIVKKDAQESAATIVLPIKRVPVYGKEVRKNGTTHIFDAETYELSSYSHCYYEKFTTELHRRVILNAGIRYDGLSKDIPTKNGPLILIQELLERIVARILYYQTESVAQDLINTLLKGFLSKLNNSEQKLEIGLIKNGQRTTSGKFLDYPGTGDGISIEITHLERFISYSAKLEALTNTTDSGLSASISDANILRQRMVIGLFYLANPSAKQFPTAILDERELTSNIQGYTEKAIQRLFPDRMQLLAKPTGKIEDRRGIKAIGNIENLISNRWKTGQIGCPITENDILMLHMLEETMQLERFRTVFSMLFNTLVNVRKATGFLILLSGAINFDNIKTAINNYLNKSRIASSHIPEFLTNNSEINKGYRSAIWTICTNEWEIAKEVCTTASDPYAQKIMAEFLAANLSQLQIIDNAFLKLGALQPGSQIINQNCFQYFCAEVAYITSSTLHPQIDTFPIKSSVEELEDTPHLNDDANILAIKAKLTSYSLSDKRNYRFNLDSVDENIRFRTSNHQDKFMSHNTSKCHIVRAEWIYHIFAKMEKTTTEQALLIEIRDAISTLYDESGKLKSDFQSNNSDGIENIIQDITILVNKRLYALLPQPKIQGKLDNIKNALTDIAKERKYLFRLPYLDNTIQLTNGLFKKFETTRTNNQEDKDLARLIYNCLDLIVSIGQDERNKILALQIHLQDIKRTNLFKNISIQKLIKLLEDHTNIQPLIETYKTSYQDTLGREDVQVEQTSYEEQKQICWNLSDVSFNPLDAKKINNKRHDAIEKIDVWAQRFTQKDVDHYALNCKQFLLFLDILLSLDEGFKIWSLLRLSSPISPLQSLKNRFQSQVLSNRAIAQKAYLEAAEQLQLHNLQKDQIIVANATNPLTHESAQMGQPTATNNNQETSAAEENNLNKVWSDEQCRELEKILTTLLELSPTDAKQFLTSIASQILWITEKKNSQNKIPPEQLNQYFDQLFDIYKKTPQDSSHKYILGRILRGLIVLGVNLPECPSLRRSKCCFLKLKSLDILPTLEAEFDAAYINIEGNDSTLYYYTHGEQPVFQERKILEEMRDNFQELIALIPENQDLSLEELGIIAKLTGPKEMHIVSTKNDDIRELFPFIDLVDINLSHIFLTNIHRSGLLGHFDGYFHQIIDATKRFSERLIITVQRDNNWLWKGVGLVAVISYQGARIERARVLLAVLQFVNVILKHSEQLASASERENKIYCLFDIQLAVQAYCQAKTEYENSDDYNIGYVSSYLVTNGHSSSKALFLAMENFIRALSSIAVVEEHADISLQLKTNLDTSAQVRAAKRAAAAAEAKANAEAETNKENTIRVITKALNKSLIQQTPDSYETFKSSLDAIIEEMQDNFPNLSDELPLITHNILKNNPMFLPLRELIAKYAPTEVTNIPPHPPASTSPLQRHTIFASPKPCSDEFSEEMTLMTPLLRKA